MEVRPATENDIPSIVDLLRESLGESLMPKSEAYWRWKHVENPFGQSPVLLAFEGATLVGVRAFMKWQWTMHATEVVAVRAVDTATHPAHQGKGIFKKLTLGLVEQCKKQGVGFVFNTPNSQSKPGYLKMGWREAGRFPVRICLQSPFSIIRNLLINPSATRFVADSSVEDCLTHSGFNKLLNLHNQSAAMVTRHSIQSLRWRYALVPVAKYYTCSLTEGNELQGAAFFRLKTSRLGLEMRVTDVFLLANRYQKKMSALLRKEAAKRNASYLTISALGHSQWFKGALAVTIVKSGPVVTLRSINDEGSPDGFSNWCPSLGDLELF